MTSREERLEQLRKAREPKPKKAYKGIPKISKKRAAEIQSAKEVGGEDETMKERWFKARRREMTGTCQCGCGKPSQKKDDMYFRHSAAHIFAKSKFESIALNPINWVERAFFGGCHSIMDDTSIERWPGMADWDDIKEKFYQLAPLLTDAEKGTKFYTHLESLVYRK